MAQYGDDMLCARFDMRTRGRLVIGHRRGPRTRCRDARKNASRHSPQRTQTERAMKLRLYREADTEGRVHLFTSSVHTLAVEQYDAAQRHAWAPVLPDIDAWRQRFKALHTRVAEGRADDHVSYLGFRSFDAGGQSIFSIRHRQRHGVASPPHCSAKPGGSA